MKKAFVVLPVMIVLMLSLVMVVSAKTLIAGKIYNVDFSDTVKGAYVEVICNNNTIETNSSFDGTYAVTYNETKCDIGDSLSVHALCTPTMSCTQTISGNSIIGENTLTNQNINDKDDLQFLDMNLAIVNVPLVPEFGLFAGALTIISALGIFFIVRRR